MTISRSTIIVAKCISAKRLIIVLRVARAISQGFFLVVDIVYGYLRCIGVFYIKGDNGLFLVPMRPILFMSS